MDKDKEFFPGNKEFSPRVKEILALMLEKAGILGKIKIKDNEKEEKQ